VLLGEVVVPCVPAHSSADATLLWQAAIIPDRPDGGREPAGVRYVDSRIRAEVGQETARGEWTGVAKAVVNVRALPVPKFCDGLVWSSDDRHAYEGRLILRAALVNELGRDVDPRLNYIPDSPLSATVTPYLGHPDEGGLPLAEPKRVENVPPTEFGLAEWNLPTPALSKRFMVWMEAVCDGPLADGAERLLAKRVVRL
jgi:hypothetical protein